MEKDTIKMQKMIMNQKMSLKIRKITVTILAI
jgi:hypothetical protein